MEKRDGQIIIETGDWRAKERVNFVHFGAGERGKRDSPIRSMLRDDAEPLLVKMAVEGESSVYPQPPHRFKTGTVYEA